MVKESEFVKRIKKVEKEGYEVDGGLMLFTSYNGPSAMIVSSKPHGASTLILRAQEHLKLEQAILKETRKLIAQLETKQKLGASSTTIPSYTD
jgi:hypothetical protein